MKNYLQIFALLLGLIFVASCNKAPQTSTDNTKKTYSSDAVKKIVKDEQTFRSIDQAVDLTFNFFDGKKESSQRWGCWDVSFEDYFWKTPNVMTVDFGDACENDHGDVYEGKIIVSYNKFLNRTGAVKTVSFENFKINGDAITGEIITSNLGRNSDNYYVLQREVKDGEINFEDGSVSTLNANNFYTFAMGGSLFDIDQKNIEILGGSDGVTKDGVTFTTFINEALIASLQCGCINAGFTTFTIDDENYTVDFGDGTCASVSQITLPDGTVESSDICE